jgi:hypothetical protein
MKEEKAKKVLVLDGISTRIVLDMSKDYIKNNPKDILFPKKKAKED